MPSSNNLRRPTRRPAKEFQSNPRSPGSKARPWNKSTRSRRGNVCAGSFAGQAGRLLQPLIAPLGFDWKMGIGIVSSFAAREVFVSTMSIVYNVAEGADEDTHTGIWPRFCTSKNGRTARRFTLR